ncbi:MAG: HDOD domain-containing protein [Bradymonadia bacterium]
MSLSERRRARGPKRKLLFVDDEQRVLDGLRDRLRRHRRKWNMTFVTSGVNALERLEEEGDYDAIISDMKMPGMDGATLLERVKEAHPRLVRIVLSGYSEMSMAERALAVAHQCLSKPCDAEQLDNVLDRACNLSELASNSTIRDLVGQIDSLPSPPSTYQRLQRILQEPTCDQRKVGAILEQDMAMAAKVLQLVNSGFYRMPRRITKVSEAIGYLGFDNVRSLVLTVDAFKGNGRIKAKTFSLESLQHHALLTAHIARRLVDDMSTAEDAFMAGMLHNIGKLIVAQQQPDYFDEVSHRAQKEDRPFHEIEREISGVTHAEVGAYLVGLWGLPWPIVEAVAHHHTPEAVPQRDFDVLSAVHVADVLISELGLAKPPASAVAFSPDYPETQGFAAELPRWREIAHQEAVKVGALDKGDQ